ncbi:protein of unknown function (plasmid) [Vibrio harveyi]|nr:protein of unknown function [Vibrio harveyi]
MHKVPPLKITITYRTKKDRDRFLGAETHLPGKAINTAIALTSSHSLTRFARAF